MNRVSEDIKRKDFFGNTHCCLECGHHFHADKDACPQCYSLNITSLQPPLKLEDCVKGYTTLSVVTTAEGVKFIFSKRKENPNEEI